MCKDLSTVPATLVIESEIVSFSVFYVKGIMMRYTHNAWFLAKVYFKGDEASSSCPWVFVTCVNNTGDKFTPVSMAPTINLPPVSATQLSVSATLVIDLSPVSLTRVKIWVCRFC